MEIRNVGVVGCGRRDGAAVKRERDSTNINRRGPVGSF